MCGSLAELRHGGHDHLQDMTGSLPDELQQGVESFATLLGTADLSILFGVRAVQTHRYAIDNLGKFGEDVPAVDQRSVTVRVKQDPEAHLPKGARDGLQDVEPCCGFAEAAEDNLFERTFLTVFSLAGLVLNRA